MQRTVLLATIGTEAQVVTAAWWALLRRGETIAEIEVFHTQAPEVLAACERLRQVAVERPGFPPLGYQLLGADQGHPLTDTATEDDIRVAFTTLFRRLQQRKGEGQRVHFLLAGGRKPLALFAMAAAQMLFDEDDHLWYLYSEEDFLASKALFPQAPTQITLVPIPLLPWVRLAPALLTLREVEDPWAAVAQARQLALDERLKEAHRFVTEELTPAEQRVAALLVREGLSDRDLAGRLYMSEKTVGRHLSNIYTKAAAFWSLERVNRAQLVTLLHLYFVAQAENEDFSP